MTSSLENADRKSANRPLCCLFKILDRKLGILNGRLRGLKFIGFMSNDQIWSMSCSMISIRKQIHKLYVELCDVYHEQGETRVYGCVPLGESGSGFLICGVSFEQIRFQTSDLSNLLWIRIHRITDLRGLKTDHWISDPKRSFGRRIRN